MGNAIDLLEDDSFAIDGPELFGRFLTLSLGSSEVLTQRGRLI